MVHLPGVHFRFHPVGNPWFSWSYVTQHLQEILTATQQHVTLTLLSVGLGLLVAVPVTALARRSTFSRAGVLGFSSALYAVPSLAFVVATYSIFGLGRLTVVIPLAAYSLVILVRNILTGLDGVPQETVDAARGMGFTDARLLLRVRLPLALPAIIAGIRIAVVSTIELVVIGGYVGQGGYGTYLFEGFHNNDYRAEITTYLILTVLLALVADQLVLGVQRLATPWRRGLLT